MSYNDTQGCLPLKGVIKNVWDEKATSVLKSKELAEIIACMRLDINDPDSVDDSYYKDICILVDFDHDGIGHISPLLQAFFYKFWPRLFEEKRVHIIVSPILIVHQKNKDDIWCYSYEEAREAKEKYPKAYFRYIKGLGSLEEEEYEQLVQNPKMLTVDIDDASLFELMFGKDSGPRKELILG